MAPAVLACWPVIRMDRMIIHRGDFRESGAASIHLIALQGAHHARP
jgi:hypothetical protein